MPVAIAETLGPTIRPEHELLLCCARTRMNSERASRIRDLLGEGIDWAYLLRNALPHGMMPLLHWHLQAVSPDAVPEDILAHLRAHFRKTVQNNLLLTGELLQLLELLESHGIPAIPYKGPVLAASIYRSLWLREFRDLDVLVHAKDVPRARDLLISRGYRTRVHLEGPREAAFISSQCEIPFERAGSSLLIELHWGITPRYFSFPLDPGQLWGRLQAVSLAGREVPSLRPEDLLLILCAHGCKHLWERLGWICDVAELVRVHPALNWMQAREGAGRLGSERMFSLGLLLASDLLQAPLPEQVMQKVRADPVARSLAAQACRRLFAEADQPPGVFERSLFHVAARERLLDGVRYCVRIATTPTSADWDLLPLPPRLWFLYHLLRPFRLLGKYVIRPLTARRTTAASTWLPSSSPANVSRGSPPQPAPRPGELRAQ